MTFRIEHELVRQDLVIEKHESGNSFFFTAQGQGSFRVMRPGKLLAQAGASVWRKRTETQTNTGGSGGGGTIDGVDEDRDRPEEFPDDLLKPDAGRVPFDMELRILDPDGNLFTADEVTVEDLRKFRTLRGFPRPWSFTAAGSSPAFNSAEDLHETVADPRGNVFIQVTETVVSESAPPLVEPTELGADLQRFTFDLYRIGDFVAEITPIAEGGAPWTGTVRLIDPDGTEIARADAGSLRCPIRFSELAPSRDVTTWAPRDWTLEVLPQSGATAGTHTVTATVLGQFRANVEAVGERAKKLFGEDGKAIQFIGNDRPKAGEHGADLIEALMTIHDPVAAETIDMLGLLDGVLPKRNNDGTLFDLEAGTPVAIGTTEADIGGGAHLYLKVGNLAVSSITAELTRSVSSAGGLVGGPFVTGTPVLRLDVAVDGHLEISTLAGGDLQVVGGLLPDPVPVGTVSAKNGHVVVEIGIGFHTHATDGDQDDSPTLRLDAWMIGDPLDFIMNGPGFAAVATAVGLVGALAVEEYLVKVVNDRVQEVLHGLFDDENMVYRTLMMLLGTHLDWELPRFDTPESVEAVFEYVAPVEAEPKPKENYAGVIGRDFEIQPTGDVQFFQDLGDTWVAENLREKIDHIVVVIMENRSYDHVLGYRAMSSRDGSRPADGADGWTQELIDAVNGRYPAPGPDGEVPARPMRFSAFEKNDAGRTTRLPSGVGHSVAAVAQQLSGQFEGPGGRQINDPHGFVENFFHKYLHDHYRDPDTGVVQYDVLRYYETDKSVTYDGTTDPVDDLPVFDFLANHFAYSDRFFCSHPGPTLPNRMLSLTGDFQHDRFGFPILDNNSGDNFLLSRAPTIFDILEREGVSWRIYESKPSVTMLRFFSRYSGETARIQPFEQFAKDVADGKLDQVVMVEPQMHAHPEDDDHPPADMWRGQRFIHDVYEALSSNRALFERTMLVITYDEHGGLYDHVIPPIAEVYKGTDLPGGGQNLGPVSGNRDDGWKPGDDPDGDDGDDGSGGAPPGTRRIRVPRGFGTGSEVAPEGTPMASGGVEVKPPTPAETAVAVPYGVRVPTFVVSPWVPAGKGPSVTLDFCSILKTILARFCADTRPFLSDRVEASQSFESFLTEPAARPTPDGLPSISDLPLNVRSGPISPATGIGTAPLFRSRMVEGEVESHELMGSLARILGR